MLPVDFFKIAGHLIEIFLNNSHNTGKIVKRFIYRYV